MLEGLQIVPRKPSEKQRQAAMKVDFQGKPLWIKLADAGLDWTIIEAAYCAMVEASEE